MDSIVIVPDVHQDIRWAELVMERFDADLFVFLGDYFDSHNNKSESNFKDTTAWLSERLGDPKCIMLLGNHDLQYFYKDNAWLKCSGYQATMSSYVQDNIPVELRERGKLYHVIEQKKTGEKFFLSHAGLKEELFYDAQQGEVTEKTIALRCHEAIQQIKIGKCDNVLSPGFERNGTFKHGGITWLDWNREFVPIENINQIVGHTSYYYPRIKTGRNSFNICLDSGQTYVGLLVPDQFAIVNQYT